jgi:hypothetical protein
MNLHVKQFSPAHFHFLLVLFKYCVQHSCNSVLGASSELFFFYVEIVTKIRIHLNI